MTQENQSPANRILALFKESEISLFVSINISVDQKEKS